MEEIINDIVKENPTAFTALALCNENYYIYTCELSSGIVHFKVNVKDFEKDFLKDEMNANLLIDYINIK